MNLFKSAFFRTRGPGKPPGDDAPFGADEPRGARPKPDNVVEFLPHVNANFEPNGVPPEDNPSAERSSAGRAGLLDAPQLLAFFAQEHHECGCHDGAIHRTQSALEQGRNGLIARFQKLLELMIERRMAEHFRLHDSLLETEGLDRSVERRLQLACERLEREIGVLRSEILAAADGKGWILEALNQYQMGFLRGVKTAIDFQLLASVAEEAF